MRDATVPLLDPQDRRRDGDATVPSHWAQVSPVEQRRTLRVLVLAQVLSGAGLAAGVTVGALPAQDMLGATSLAGLPSALPAGR